MRPAESNGLLREENVVVVVQRMVCLHAVYSLTRSVSSVGKRHHPYIPTKFISSPCMQISGISEPGNATPSTSSGIYS